MTIEAKIRYATAEDSYPAYENVSDAKSAARESVLTKYIRMYQDPPTPAYTETKGWFGRTHMEWRDQKTRTACQAKTDFIKFYDNIMADLKAIDDQPTPTPVAN